MRYSRAVLTLALALLLSGFLLPYSPLALLISLAALWLWGEDAVVWIYTRVAPVEPVRVAVGQGHRAAYDPRRKLYYWLWSVEPNRSVLGFASIQTNHEFYNKLALRPHEELSFVYLYGEKFILFTSRVHDPQRVKDVDSVLREFFVAVPEEPWTGYGKPVGRWIWLTSIWVPIYAAATSPWALLLLLPWLWHVRNFARYYREPYSLLAFTHKPHIDAFSLSRETLELAAAADSKAFGHMDRWAVAFADRPAVEVEKLFSKTYEGRDTGKRLVRLSKYKELLERVSAFNERPIYLYVYAEREVPSMSVVKDYIASVDFWTRREPVRALTGDLTRFPIFHGGKPLGRSRMIELAVDIFGKPVAVPVDSLPTAHGVIVGPSGMGKSWTVASWLRRLSRFANIIIVDPHGDYLKWAKAVGAEVVPVPLELPEDLPEVLRRSMWFRRLVGAEGTDGVDAKAKIEGEAKAKGVTPKYIKTLKEHIVFDLTPLKKDSEAQAFWAATLLVYLIEKFLEERVEQLKTIIVFDEARLLSKHGASRYGETLLAMIEDLVQGGRKYGFAVWFVVQLETQLPQDILRSASIQLFLGGARDYVLPLARTVELDNDDVAYLLSAITPREAALSGKPYAMGILRIKPRDHKYHVKIELDPSLK